MHFARAGSKPVDTCWRANDAPSVCSARSSGSISSVSSPLADERSLARASAMSLLEVTNCLTAALSQRRKGWVECLVAGGQVAGLGEQLTER